MPDPTPPLLTAIRRRLGGLKRRLLGRSAPGAGESAQTAAAAPGGPIYAWSQDGAELSIATPEPPMHLMNVLYNRTYFTHLDHLGRGRGFHQSAGGHLNNIIENDRLLYLRDDASGDYCALSFAPVFRPCAAFRFTAGINYQTIEQEIFGLRVRWRLWVPAGDDPLEVWDVQVENPGAQARRVSLISHVVVKCDGTELDHGDLYRTAKYDPDLHAVFVRQDAERHQFIEHPLHNGFVACAPAPIGWNASPGTFIGARRSLANPLSVEQGKLAGAPAIIYTPTVSLHVALEVAPHATAPARWLTGACDTPARIAEYRSRYLTEDDWAGGRFAAMRAALRERYDAWHFDLPEHPELAHMFNGWVPAQIHMGATWCRWGWKGYRDVLQQTFAVTAFDAEAGRESILGACANQHADGFGVRGWLPLDARRYVDGHAWLILGAVEYLKETADFALLEEPVAFLEPSAPAASVFEHLHRALDRLWNDRGAHGLCLLFEADWNDSLTGAGRAGRGESVMVSMMFCRCAAELADLVEWLGRPGDAAQYRAWGETMRAALREHAWDGGWWRCAYDDHGHPIGSAQNEEGQIFLIPQAWAQLAGVADAARWEAAWGAVEARLDPGGWGLMLNDPPYTHPQPNIGRMSYLCPGHNENASVYVHGSAFAFVALLERGLPDRALRAMLEILPGLPGRPVACQPNVFFNAFYGPASELMPGLADHAWYTGSAAWFFMGLTELMLGVRRGYGGLTIRPCLPSGWRELTVTRRFRGTTFQMRLISPSGRPGAPVRRITIDGIDHDPALPLPLDGTTHQVLVEIGD